MSKVPPYVQRTRRSRVAQCIAGSGAASGRDLFSDVELDPVEESLIVDRASMGSPLAERFEVCFASLTYVGVVDGGEGDQFDRVNLDLAIAHAIASTRSHFRPPPQPERHRYFTRQNVPTQFPAELHGVTLRRLGSGSRSGYVDGEVESRYPNRWPDGRPCGPHGGHAPLGYEPRCKGHPSAR